MTTSPESPPITNITPPPNGQQNILGTIQDDLSRSTKRINKAVEKIQTNNNRPTTFNEMNQSAIETSAIMSIKKPEIIYLDSSNSSQNATNMDCEQQHSQQALSNEGLQTEPNDSSKDYQEQQRTSATRDTDPQMNPYQSPPNSSIYRTPPSSIRSESISDLIEDDIIELNKIS